MLARRIAIAVVGMATLSTIAAAQQATQVVRFEVIAKNLFIVVGSPAPLVMDSAVAGSAPASVTAGGSSYAIVTSETNQKITASIDAVMSAGLSLEVSLAAPAGAASLGAVRLSKHGSEVLRGISEVAASALPITYRLNVAPFARMTTQLRMVTFTMIGGA